MYSHSWTASQSHMVTSYSHMRRGIEPVTYCKGLNVLNNQDLTKINKLFQIGREQCILRRFEQLLQLLKQIRQTLIKTMQRTLFPINFEATS